MRIAVEGCCHGELDKLYQTLQHLESREQTQIDMLICCGDFQAVRNYDDLTCLACPDKYKQLNTFWKYYCGAATAPYLTVFKLSFGGWVAPNIYFLGNAGVVKFGGVRIGGLTGIFNQRHYRMGHFEVPPYTQSSMRSAYHIRELDVYRLMQLRQPLDIFLSHDWPSRIADHGDRAQLCRCKKFLAKEIMDGSLGSPPAAQLLKELQPAYWFSAHMHVKFPALVPHATPHHPTPSSQPACTHFLALDKCLPGRGFLQVVDFPDAQGPKELCYDEEWLAVLRSTHHLMKMQQRQPPLPGVGRRAGPPQRDIQAVADALKARGGAAIPLNFAPTAPFHDPQGKQSLAQAQMPAVLPRNPQTMTLLAMLGLPYNLDPSPDQGGSRASQHMQPESNPEEIDLDTGSSPEEAAGAAAPSANPEEIDLDGMDNAADSFPAEANPEEIALEDLDDADDEHAEDESPPDRITHTDPAS